MALLKRVLHPFRAASLLPQPHPALVSVPTADECASPLLPHTSHRGRARNAAAIIEPTTGPLEELANLRTLVAVDLENIDRSAQDLHRAIDYRQLARLLTEKIGVHAHLTAIFSGDGFSAEAALRRAGWATYSRPIDVVRSNGRMIRHSNADTVFATAVGAATVALNVEAVLLGSGDGQLLIDVARCLKALVPRIRTYATLSLPGSTSHRLDARRSDIFSFNVEIGADVLCPLPMARVRPPVPQGQEVRAATGQSLH